MNEKIISADILDSFTNPDRTTIDKLLADEFLSANIKIVVLDDDPTGVQTVHDVSVYTNWSIESIREGFSENNRLFFILTNSRGFTEEQTRKAHIEIAENVNKVAKEFNCDYIIISRGDSTLRGHYPLETQLLKEVSEENGVAIDGEIICPYFKEGGRFTINDVHYVKYGNELVPAAQTEFAKDETFGYAKSNLCEYVEEKTKGAFTANSCKSISLEQLKNCKYDEIEAILMDSKDFNKIIVNAISDEDVEVFAIALYRAMKKGKHFVIRCAAALVKAIGNVSDKPILTREELRSSDNSAGGIIVVGSHTKKTTAQLEKLKGIKGIEFIEMDSDLVLESGALEKEVDNILCKEEELLKKGITVCVSTKRNLLKVDNDTPEEALLRSIKISDALKDCVGRLTVKPSFIVAKGGITSSDVGIKALQVKKAIVMGQIQPGVPVWKTGNESKFADIPYVIFPGNVGAENTLKEAVSTLI
ncbi:MAG: hydroxyacid dehydrogenase [Pseudobutyrivibrio ruminis]|nr:four-carbon acid sugar kinase family protein [Pseudobutyrivibrio ruminis]MBE5913897.1 hydroxyacid dehydrogenase [Pseudobutyrivibrio ruminis]